MIAILLFLLFEIYIPIWIDLKVEIQPFLERFGVIYIPIWIDLKAVESYVSSDINIDLHSNMDRFES